MYKVYKLNSFTPPFKKEFVASFLTYEEAKKFVEGHGSIGYMIDY